MQEDSAVMQPLKDVRVLAVTVFLAGPFCGMNLARLGAEVIKVEIPGRGDPVRSNGPFSGPDGTHLSRQSERDLSTRFLKRNQGVQSVTLNLKHPEGRQIFLDLAKRSDIVVENLAPGSMKRLGLGYDEVSEVNPRVIYCSISGYGQTGPYASKPAHDPQIQAMSGMMEINGDQHGPPTRVGLYIGDLITPLFACYSIMAALRERDKNGGGQYLDVSMMDSLVTLMFMENLEETVEGGLPLRTGNITRSGPTGLYHTRDGDITLTAVSDDQWRKLCSALDAPELLEDPRFADYRSRVDHVEVARGAIQRLLEGRSRGDALDRLEAFDVPCSAVRGVAEVMADQHLWERGVLQPMRHSRVEGPVGGIASGFPVVFSGGAVPPPRGAPTLGMHNDEVYGGLLGIGEDQLLRLRDDGVM